MVQLEGVLDPPGQRGIEFAIAVDGALGIGSHGALYQNCVTRKSAGQEVSAPRATGRAGSRIHSLHDPAYSRAPASPAASSASRLWQAVTPEPHIAISVAAGGSRGVSAHQRRRAGPLRGR